MLRLMLRSCATLRRFGCACLRLSSPSCLRSRSALRHLRDDARVLAQAQEQADHAVLLRTRLVAPEGIADAGGRIGCRIYKGEDRCVCPAHHLREASLRFVPGRLGVVAQGWGGVAVVLNKVKQLQG